MKQRSVHLYAEIAHLNKNNKIFKTYLKPSVEKRGNIYLNHFRKYETDNEFKESPTGETLRDVFVLFHTKNCFIDKFNKIVLDRWHDTLFTVII
jgi:hypothetical protein